MSHILIVEATFYEDIAAELIKGAVSTLEAETVNQELSHSIISVPGALEIPAAIRMAIESKRYDGYIALGCVIRGETTHYDYVCTESAHGLNQLALDHVVPIGNGILTTENREQAIARAEVARGNKGKAAAHACITMHNLKKHYGLVP
jgi:6,7-dimethyl-8-ribityllumazine synthase